MPIMAFSQQFRLIESNEVKEVYELKNDSLHGSIPFELTILDAGNGNNYKIVEQRVRQRVLQQIPENPTGLTPLVEVKGGGIVKKKPVLRLHVHVSRTQGKIEYVTEYLKIEIYKPAAQPKKGRASTFAVSDHKLASGQWLKIEFNSNGIFEITPQQLQAAGWNIASIDPRKIQLWGSNGELLPELNALANQVFEEIPIYLTGENDGVLNATDRIYFYGATANRSYRTQNSFQQFRFSHKINYYATSQYVFLTIGSDDGLRMVTANAGLSSNTIVSEFKDHVWKEDELYKTEEHMRSGRQWLGQVFSGESFGNTATLLADTIIGFRQNSTIDISMRYYARSSANSIFTTYLNGMEINSSTVTRLSNITSETDASANYRDVRISLQSSLVNNVFNLTAKFNNTSTGSLGWLDYVDIEIYRSLTAENGKLHFFPDYGLNVSEPVKFILSGFESVPVSMDVTNPLEPKLLSSTLVQDQVQLVYYPEPLNQYVSQTTFNQVISITALENQNISGTVYQPDYLIITAPDFLEQANRLADYREHADGFKALVVTQEQIFNEFSAGNKDIMGIRLFVRYFYDRATNDDELPKYLLLFGDTHFDYKGIEQTAPLKNLVFTYESPESIHRYNSFASDDFFGLLDANEGAWTTTGELLDIGVGRLPVQSISQAKLMVDKIIAYENTDTDFSNWRSLFTYIADDDFPSESLNKDLHVVNADGSLNVIDTDNSGIRIKKIYFFDYPLENTAAGRRRPAATRDFINTINNGSLVVNYSGHGAERILSDERFFTVEMIPELTNKTRPTIFVTATCSFGRFDDNLDQSGAEQMVLHDNGGAIASFTTTRVVYTNSTPGDNNYGLNIALSRAMTEREEHSNLPRRFGDVYQITKTTGTVGPSINSRRFILLGDPATRMAMPQKQVKITAINNQLVSQVNEVGVNSLEEITVQGEVHGMDNVLETSFNGYVTVQIVDSERFVALPVKDSWNGCYMPNCGYYTQTDVLFSGKTNVVNGVFQQKFILPKNVSINNGFTKILLYANEGDLDGMGAYSKMMVTGVNTSAVNDGVGPELDVYLNDESFVRGSLVNETPTLIVKIADPSGINTAASGVGQEIVAMITSPNGETNNYILNDYFETDLNNYKQGEAHYTIPDLFEGDYSLTVRAWDIFNNPSEQSTDFTVTSTSSLIVRNVYNYPNPMHSKTKFIIEHNQPNTALSVLIRVFTLSGKPVYHYQNPIYVTSSPFITIDWDGTDKDGDKLATGTYLYHVRIKADTPNGQQTVERIEKLVIIQ